MAAMRVRTEMDVATARREAADEMQAQKLGAIEEEVIALRAFKAAHPTAVRDAMRKGRQQALAAAERAMAAERTALREEWQRKVDHPSPPPRPWPRPRPHAPRADRIDQVKRLVAAE